MKTIVISAVNIRKGGTLTILRNCLEYLSLLATKQQYRVIAIVHDKSLADYDKIEYIELPWSIKSWAHRLWCEYITMNSISKRIKGIDLWFSLHDTTPNVKAKRQAVYCQTSFPFLKWKWRDFLFDYKIPLFALFTKYAYKINIKKNDYLVVQQEWLRQEFSKMFHILPSKFIVAPPAISNKVTISKTTTNDCHTFLYVATPDCHKNFELLCEAAKQLESELGEGKFKVILTINGSENSYSKWLFKKWGDVRSIQFHGLMSRQELQGCYRRTDCLVFPSRIETWGLPISEFATFNKPMLLSNLPYAQETASGSKNVSFFTLENHNDLKSKMKKLVVGDFSDLSEVPRITYNYPYSKNWEELFFFLLKN